MVNTHRVHTSAIAGHFYNIEKWKNVMYNWMGGRQAHFSLSSDDIMSRHKLYNMQGFFPMNFV